MKRSRRKVRERPMREKLERTKAMTRGCVRGATAGTDVGIGKVVKRNVEVGVKNCTQN